MVNNDQYVSGCASFIRKHLPSGLARTVREDAPSVSLDELTVSVMSALDGAGSIYAGLKDMYGPYISDAIDSLVGSGFLSGSRNSGYRKI